MIWVLGKIKLDLFSPVNNDIAVFHGKIRLLKHEILTNKQFISPEKQTTCDREKMKKGFFFFTQTFK